MEHGHGPRDSTSAAYHQMCAGVFYHKRSKWQLPSLMHFRVKTLAACSCYDLLLGKAQLGSPAVLCASRGCK